MNRLTGMPAVFCMLLCGCSTVAQVGVPAAPLVDYHQHLVSPAFSHIVKADPVYGADLMKKLDAAGIEQAVVLSTGYSFADERKGFADPHRLTREENDSGFRRS